MKKYPLLLAALFAFLACKDQIVDTETITKTVTTPSICPPATYPDPPSTAFSGIQSVESIERSRFKIRWNEASEAQAFLVFVGKSGEKMKLYRTVEKNRTSTWVQGLEPETRYNVSVKLLDDRGLYDINETVLSATTTALPSYRNRKALYFDGFASIGLGPSNELLPNQGFTVSAWFKTSRRQSSGDARLVTLHSGFSASTALTLGVEDDRVFLGYRTDDGVYRELAKDFNYYENEWHHIAATYNGKYLSLYLNGKRTFYQVENFIGLGSHPARIGSYTGNKKGFTGLIDEVSFWSTAMGKSKIDEIIGSGSASNLFLHSRSASLRSWHRMGDDDNDGPTHLQDQLDSFHGLPLNIEADDFIQDNP